jgi:hypothetical protein
VDPAGISALRDVIRRLHGCESRWVESVRVDQAHEGTPWEGEVQVFEVLDHPKAQRAYVWSYPTDRGERRFHALLALPPVDSPIMAVQLAVLVEAALRVSE